MKGYKSFEPYRPKADMDFTQAEVDAITVIVKKLVRCQRLLPMRTKTLPKNGLEALHKSLDYAVNAGIAARERAARVHNARLG